MLIIESNLAPYFVCFSPTSDKQSQLENRLQQLPTPLDASRTAQETTQTVRLTVVSLKIFAKM
jgi:hypothetical protein